MSRVRKVENRKPMQPERTVIDLGIPAHIHHHGAGAEPPVGIRKFAGRNGAVVDHVVIGTGFLHDFAGEGKRSGRGQHYAAALKAEPGRGGDVVEAPGFSRQIVGSMTSFDVVVVGAAVESEMSGSRGLAAVGVVRDFIGPQDVGAIVNFGVAVQFVNLADFFLLQGADGSRIGVLARGLTGAGSGGSGCWSLPFLWSRRCGRTLCLARISGKQLAGY